MHICFIIMEDKYAAIDTNDYSRHGYYIIKFSSSPYIIKIDFIIDGQVIFAGEKLCEGPYLFQININSNYYVLQRTKSINTIFSLRKIIIENVNVICIDLKDVFPPCLQYISQNSSNTLPPLNIIMKEYDNIMDEKNLREIIEFEISVSIGIQNTTYDYNDEFWDTI